VRASEHGEEPLVVIVTAHDELSSKLTGFSVGADDYLVKPINPQELFTRVTKLLASRDAHARTVEQRRRDAIREVATTICHQVNSPLTVAVGYLDLLIHRRDLSTQVQGDLGECRAELLRIVEILERLRVVEDRVVPYLGDAKMIDLPPAKKTQPASQPRAAASTRMTST
jgi:DNA-binding response OmpR family regulator